MRHTGEGREFIDHPADIIDLPSDDRQIFAELCAGPLVIRLIFAAQPVGGELDRRQRVLDFMGNTARYIRPGSLALRCQQIRDIIEGHDITDHPPVHFFRGNPRAQRQPASGAGQDDLVLGEFAAARAAGSHKTGEFRHNILKAPANHISIGKAKKLS